jgi:nucleoside-diphosphate-sugar epimerase
MANQALDPSDQSCYPLPMSNRVLITGGAGFLGINLVRYLLDRGYQVTSLDLEPFDYADCKDRVRSVTGDIRRSADVAHAIEGCDYVVHCAAALPLYSPSDIYSTDVAGTRVVLQEAKRVAAKRVVHVSSTAVYGIPDHHPLLETDKLDGVGPYGEAKISAERVCEEYRAQGMCVPIVRPKSFVGPERLGVFALFYDWAREGHGFPLLGNGKNRYQLLDVEDLCESIYLTMTVDEAVANDTFTTMREDFQAVLDEAGFGKKMTGLPAGPAIWTLRILEQLKLSPLYKWVYETASTDSFVSIEKAEKLLGYKPTFSTADAMVRNYRWYLANLNKFANTSGVSHRVPWKQGVLRLGKWMF